jgi:hypothetical protein
MLMYEFAFATGKVTINHEKCKECKSYACIKACSLFGRAILRIENGKPGISEKTRIELTNGVRQIWQYLLMKILEC